LYQTDIFSEKALEDGLEVNLDVMVVGKTSKVEPVVNS
jgi:hypothetical protein